MAKFLDFGWRNGKREGREENLEILVRDGVPATAAGGGDGGGAAATAAAAISGGS
jgi:hypothetical protein